MADTYVVKITSQAQGQMKEIVHYISHELKNPDAAFGLLDDLEEAMLSLAHMPQRVPLIKEMPWREQGVRKIPVKNFLVYFWIDEEKRKVQVTAVVYGKRDQMRQLEDMEMQ